MNRLNKILCVLLFITTVGSAQIKRIQFVSDEDQLPLSNVEVYNGNLLLGKSDPKGYLDLNTGGPNYLHMMKEDYKDSFIKVLDLQDRVTLVKNKTILLNEVVVGRKVKLSIRKVLNRIRENFEVGLLFGDMEKYKLPRHFNMTNKFLMGKDTLHYLNGLMNFESGTVRICKNFRLEKKFQTEPIGNGLFYHINESYMNFSGHNSVRYLTVPYMFDNDYTLARNILENRKNYQYTVTNIGEFYKVEFVSKGVSAFGFNGYLIVDKKDFGIYEFKAELSDNIGNNDESVFSMNYVEQTYHITGADYYTKYQKDKDGNYQIVCSYSNKQFEQTKGNFKGKKFSFSSKVEAADNYKDFEFVGFDVYTYELKH